MLGIGLIGLGQHGSRYARHIVDDLPDAALVAVCQRSRTEGTKLAATYGSLSTMTTVISWLTRAWRPWSWAVPPMLHPAIVDATCRAGKPLLVEKPLATSLAAARCIANAVSTSGVRAMVAHTLRFDSTVQTLQAHLSEIAPLHPPWPGRTR
jgi:predicted dehydrogenase